MQTRGVMIISTADPAEGRKVTGFGDGTSAEGEKTHFSSNHSRLFVSPGEVARWFHSENATNLIDTRDFAIRETDALNAGKNISVEIKRAE